MKHLLETIWYYLILFLLVVSSTFASADAKYKVAILMFDDVQIIDFAGPYEVFGQAGFDVFTVSTDGEPIKTVMGLDVTPTFSFANMPQVDAILVPGGNVHDVMQDASVKEWLKQMQASTQYLLSVCTGAYILAETGLLDNKSATTFHRALNGFEKDYPKVNLQREKRFVDNGQIITSAGLSSGLDASLHLVSKVLGLEKARTLAMHLEYDWDPTGGFVRAQMADMYFPDNNINWPEDVDFERDYSFGNKSHWRTTYKATTSSTTDTQLLSFYQIAMESDKNWKLVDNKKHNSLQFIGVDGGERKNWEHRVTIDTLNDENHYMITLEIHSDEHTGI
ncbi:DJ-1/PfpI family protein [Glaciecola sp. 1036]|uniref:DJ-1/PfpI family protein n=1 Tax=Alteromonadaceae TaxID=72275 RepID=UPI003D04F94A